MMIFSANQVNAQNTFNVCCDTKITIDSDGFLTASIGEEVKIFKVWNGGTLLASFNEYNGDEIPAVIESIGADGNPIVIPCNFGNFWLDIQCPSGNCVFNASQNVVCKTGEKLSSETVAIYPNPAIDFINIELPFADESYTINVLDLSGRVVETISSNGGQTMLSTENLNAGLYMVNVESETRTYTQKVQIVK